MPYIINIGKVMRQEERSGSVFIVISPQRMKELYGSIHTEYMTRQHAVSVEKASLILLPLTPTVSLTWILSNVNTAQQSSIARKMFEPMKKTFVGLNKKSPEIWWCARNVEKVLQSRPCFGI